MYRTEKTLLFLIVLLLTTLSPFVIERGYGQIPGGLKGPTYYANIKLERSGDVFPPGPGETSKKVKVDTGAQGTLLSRAHARQFGLLDANNFPNETLLGGTVPIGGVTGGALVFYSVPLNISIQGKKCDCTAKDPTYKKIKNIRVLYPYKSKTYTGPDMPSLLGTNVMGQITDAAITLRKEPAPAKKSVSFFDTCPSPHEPRGSKLKPEPKTPPPGTEKRKQIGSTDVMGIYADFYIATGSPYTIIGQSLSLSLGLSPIDNFDLYNLDRSTFNTLFYDGFFDDVDPGPLSVLLLDYIKIPTVLGDYKVFSNVKVLVNPFSDDDLIGTNVLSVHDNTVIDLTHEIIVWGHTRYLTLAAYPKVDEQWWYTITSPDERLQALLSHEVDAGEVRPWDVDDLEAAGFTIVTEGSGIWAFTGPYDTMPGAIGIVNMRGFGPLHSYNRMGKVLGRAGRYEDGKKVNIWILPEYIDTLNPLTAYSESAWQVLNLVTEDLMTYNPYTYGGMPWAASEEPTLEIWDGYPGHEVTGIHMSFEVREGLKWHDGMPITADDAMFCLNLMRFQEVEKYWPIWEPIYDVVKTGTYTWEVYYDVRYIFAGRDVGNIALMTPKHIWEGFINPTVDAGTGPMGGDVWTATENHHSLWRGWENSIGRDTYNEYPEMDLTELIGFGPFIYHLGGWMPGISVHVEANPRYMDTNGLPLWICVGDVNLDQYCEGHDIWHVLRRIGHEEYMPIWYQYLGIGPSLQGSSVDIRYPAQVIDMAEKSLLALHTGHWWGPGDPPDGWLKEPAG